MPLPDFDTLEPVSTAPDFESLQPIMESMPAVKISPYEKYRLSGAEPVAGPFGPASPQEVPALVEAAQRPFVKLPESVGDPLRSTRFKGLVPAAYKSVAKPVLEGLESPLGVVMAPALAGSVPLRIAAGVGFGGMAAKSGLEKMGSEDPQTQLEGRMELASAPLLALAGGGESGKVIRDVPRGTVSPEALVPAIREIGGEIVPGKPGDTHPDIIKEEGVKAENIDQRGFSDPEGKVFLDRETAAKGTQLPTEFEPERLHSTDLPEAKPAEKPMPKLSTEISADDLGVLRKQLEDSGYMVIGHGGERFLSTEKLWNKAVKSGDWESGFIDDSKLPQHILNTLTAYRKAWKQFEKEAPPAAVTGEAKPSEPPASKAGEGAVTAAPTAQAIPEANVTAPVAQAPSVTQPVTQTPKGGELQMTVVPGAKEFVEQDLVPFAEEVGKTITETSSQVKSLLSPPTMGEPAKLASGIIREKKAELAQKDVQAREKFAKAKSEMDRLSKPASIDFINRVELGHAQDTPELNELQSSLRGEFDKRVEEVRALGTGKLEHVLQDYFPHIWKDPESAVSWYARILGKRPLKGPASFLKHRTIPTTVDGIAAGLQPVSYNPIELSLLKFHEMDRYVMGQKIFSEFKDKGLAQFSRSDIPPEGFAKIDDRIANVVEYRPTTLKNGAPGAPERILRGHWYVQQDAARILNNFLSPGLERYKWFRAIRWIGNTMNMAQLGLSGYHFTFTMIDSGTSKLSLGLEQIAQGKAPGLLKTGKGVVPAVNQLEYYLKGSKVLQEYTKPGSVGGEYTKIVDSLLAGGGRTEMPRIFNNSSLANFMTALRSGNYPGAVIRAPFAALEAVSHPLMQNIVPRLKLGVFSDMALAEIGRMGPNVTRDQVRARMGKIWDSVDNRMGEMVYDNLFWNRNLKDLSFLAVRAVGWNLGTIRELGGGVMDSTTFISRLRKEEPLVTRRMAYVMALPITVGTMGAMYQYAKTGKGPEELRDYFYPKTGRILPDGTAERVNFPSYLKDMVSYRMHPLKTLTNKLHPLWSEMSQMLENKDYYGAEIRNPDDPIVKQIGEELAFVGRNFVPFSVRGAERRVGAKESPETKAESFFGIMPISPEIARTAAQNKIIDYAREKSPIGGRTPEEQERHEFTRDVESQLQSPKDYQKIQQDLVKSMREGKLSRGQMLYQQSKLNFERQQMASGKTKSDAQWLWRFRHLNPQQAAAVYEISTPEEKNLFNRDYQLKLRKAQ